jgi:hypothetical protein
MSGRCEGEQGVEGGENSEDARCRELEAPGEPDPLHRRPLKGAKPQERQPQRQHGVTVLAARRRSDGSTLKESDTQERMVPRLDTDVGRGGAGRQSARQPGREAAWTDPRGAVGAERREPVPDEPTRRQDAVGMYDSKRDDQSGGDVGRVTADDGSNL